MIYFGEGSGLLFIIVCIAVFAIYKMDMAKRERKIKQDDFIFNSKLNEIDKFYNLKRQGHTTLHRSDFKYTDERQIKEWANIYNIKFI